METSLHRQLKRAYAADESQVEVLLGSYRIDAVRDDELIEIQCASLAAIREKTQTLLQRHRVRVVKPIVARTRILKRKKKGGAIVSRRMSPKRGSVLDVFDELIYFTRLFPHPNLTIEVPLVDVQQTRFPNPRRRRRWHKDYQVQDVELESIGPCYELAQPADLLDLLGANRGWETFNTADLAKAIGRSRLVAQKVAYVLKHTGAIKASGRTRAGIHYRPAA